MSTTTSEHQVRLQKVAELRAQGIEPWGDYKQVGATTAQVLAAYELEKDEAREFTIAGRLMTIREHGKTIFANLQDRSGQMQLYIRKDEIGDAKFDFFKKYVDLGDLIWVRGTAFVTRMGETTLKVLEIVPQAKSLHPLPEKFHGLQDVEQRYRQRYLDLISNPESREKFIKRSKIVAAVRDFLQRHDFLEVETPMLHPIPGGATARPFVTHHNAYDMELFLRIAPELYLKRLVIGGLERVFEINRNFRNEGVSTKHNPEFTMLEFYLAHADYHVGMELTEQLIGDVIEKHFGTTELPYGEVTLNFAAPFKRMTVEESLHEVAGLSYDVLAHDSIDELIKSHELTLPHKNASYGEKLWALFEELVEGKLIQPTYITGHPIEISPLAKRDDENPYTVARFELFCAGMEIANGFSELNDPADQADRFKRQVEAKEAGAEEAHHYDADYVTALEYGMPPTCGVGLGIDRLVMLLTDTHSIKDVILFPTMRPLR